MEGITELLVVGGSTLITVASGVFSGIKYLNLKNKLKKVESYDTIYDVIFDSVKLVESQYKPLEKQGINCAKMKKADVMDAAEKACLANGWDFDKDYCENTINDLLGFSKSVNYIESADTPEVESDKPTTCKG